MSQHTTQESCDCPLSEDPFVQTVIRRKVRQLMVFPEFYPHEEEDLRQELLAQLDVGMKRHRAELGHRNPFIVMVVDRKAANLLEYRRQQMRAEKNIGSLNVPATESDGNRPMYRAALHYYGSWRAALAASGINLAHTSRRRPKHLDLETMMLWLKERKAAGQTLVWTEVCLENRTYALAIRRRFRSWKKALEAAGLADPD